MMKDDIKNNTWLSCEYQNGQGMLLRMIVHTMQRLLKKGISLLKKLIKKEDILQNVDT